MILIESAARMSTMSLDVCDALEIVVGHLWGRRRLDGLRDLRCEA